ncbi:MAG: protease family protein [Thermotogota bacterium]|nr:protease family protein [Thermotogota bacterium]MDK2864008.1 protease family protein [Thermotogota bacterium]HCZ06529.1 hypothetical protein [Thermotogota bacterium]
MRLIEELLAVALYLAIPFSLSSLLRRSFKRHAILAVEVILGCYGLFVSVWFEIPWFSTKVPADVVLVIVLTLLVIVFILRRVRQSLPSGYIRIPAFDMFLISAVFVGLAEEPIFRGIIQNLIHRYLPWSILGLHWSTVLTALVFTFFHATNVLTRFESRIEFALAFPARFVISLLIGFTYQRTGVLIAPVIFHNLLDLVIFLSTRRH